MPSVPPTAVSVVLSPLQIVVVPDIDVGTVDSVFTVTVTLAHEVVLHVPVRRT